MKDKKRNNLEIFNEITTSLIIIMMLLLTDYVPSPLVRYSIGWLFIYVIYFQIGINTVFFLVDLK